MDHKVSKDMISSGMIPSGEKTQADLGRTQYGSAPSPSKLMDAYKSMYEHHQKDKDGNTIPHEDDVKEGKEEGGFISNVSKAEVRNQRRFDKKGSGEPTGTFGQGTSEKAKLAAQRTKEHEARRGVKTGASSYTPSNTTTEDVDLFDVVSDVFVAEGYEKKDAYKVMSQLTEEQLNEIAVTGTIATLGAGLLKGMLGAGKVAAAAGKGLASAGKAAAVKGMTAAKSAASGLKNVAQTGMSKATKALGKVSNIAKDKAKGMGDTMSDFGKFVGDEVKGEVRRKIIQGNNTPSNKITKTGQLTAPTANINSSADLFDIIKGQLLDEGMSEEEIKDIMLELTPEEIMNEMNGTRTSLDDYGTPEKRKAMKDAVEVSKKVNRYGGKTPSGTTTVDAKKGIEDVRKSM